MTLILTCMSPRWVVQACDCRISRGGVPEHDEAMKLLFFSAGSARLSICYTGIATAYEPPGYVRPLDTWLGETVSTLATETVDIAALARALLPRLHALCSTYKERHPTSSDALTLLFCGLFDGPPGAGAFVVSNQAIPSHRLPLNPDELAKPSVVAVPIQSSWEAFTCTYLSKTSGVGLLVHGSHSLLSEEIADSLRTAVNVAADTDDVHAIGAALVGCIRRVAITNPNGPVSGEAWTRIARAGVREDLVEAHGRDGERQVFYPPLIRPGQRVEWTVIADKPSERISNVVSKLKSGLLVQRFDRHTLEAYLLWSPRVAELANLLTERGCSITQASELDALLTLVSISGHRYAKTMESYASRAGPWANDLVMAWLARGSPDGTLKRVVLDRDVLLAYILVSLEPDRYPIERPLGVRRWVPTAEFCQFAREHNPAYRSPGRSE